MGVGGTWPTLKTSILRDRKDVKAVMGDLVAAALGPLWLRTFAHAVAFVNAVPLAQNSLLYFLSSLLLASHYLSKISSKKPSLVP